jgi:hypothetical protein
LFRAGSHLDNRDLGPGRSGDEEDRKHNDDLEAGMLRNRIIAAAALLAAVGIVGISALPAEAAGAYMSASATLPSGGSRVIAASWGFNAPYQVNFQCHVPGCANYVTSSTTTTSLARSVSFITCSGFAATSTISIVENGGGTAGTSTTTWWTAGKVC